MWRNGGIAKTRGFPLSGKSTDITKKPPTAQRNSQAADNSLEGYHQGQGRHAHPPARKQKRCKPEKVSGSIAARFFDKPTALPCSGETVF